MADKVGDGGEYSNEGDDTERCGDDTERSRGSDTTLRDLDGRAEN